jgi:predicted PurR-regulated permease PerM
LARDTGKLTEAATAYIGPVSSWLLTIARVIGSGVLELTLSIIAVFFFYRDGTAAAKRLAGVVDRLAGARAHRLLDVAHGTIKGVVYGVIGTAIAQGTLIGIGLWAAGVPGAFFLALVSTFVALVPPGPIIVWLPSAIWLFNRDETAWAIFLALWGFLVVGMIDNIIKPLFISRGSAMPLLLVFLGILGGGLAFGFLGLFIGPTLLAVSYTLLREWGTTRQAASAPPVAAESTE